MNLLEAQLDYAFGDSLPATGCVQQVAPGVLWLRMGLPFALNHINLWLLEDEFEQEGGVVRGWTAIDCGISSAPTKEAWETIFIDCLQGLPIVRVLVTHCHPDHVGLADWLCQRWATPLWMSLGEYTSARIMSAGLPGADGMASLPHFERNGLVEPVMLDQMRNRKAYYSSLVPSVPHAFTRMQDGQSVKIGAHDWRVITGFGHAPEHVALYCAELNVLISGDMVLPRISTNVSVFALEPNANPVQQYLDSLAKFQDLPADALVLPSHGKPFRGLHTRITQLVEHHAARLAEVLDVCITPQSGADIVPLMFKRELDMHQYSFALGEALAHLHKLWLEGSLRRHLDDDGILRFQRITH